MAKVVQQDDTYEVTKNSTQVTTVVNNSEPVIKETVSRDTKQSINSPNDKLDSTKIIEDKEVIPVTKTKKIEDINVITDYDWTYSVNKTKRETVPRVEIKEFKLAANTYISSLISSTLLFPDILSSSTENVKELSNLLIQSITPTGDNQFSKFFNNLGNKTEQFVSGTSDLVNSGVEKISNFVSNQFSKLDNTSSSWNEDIKNNYSYLYLRVSTGRAYTFPYFGQEYYSIGNSFDDSYDPQTHGEKILKNLSETAEQLNKLSSLFTATEPGMYVQRPKFYKFADDGNSITVNFILFNTITPNAYIKNLDLITKLIIQNTPHRFNRLLVDPPSIYEVRVPGKCFYPYAYISELSVDHIGVKRMISNKIIPDAYSVKIVLKSLTSEVNNFLVPEMGDAGIDVTKRYRILQPNQIKSVPPELKDQITKKTENPESTQSQQQNQPQIQSNVQEIEYNGRKLKTTKAQAVEG